MIKRDAPVLIAGGGIGGLVTALTLQQIGVPCLVLESAPQLKPLGVGINLQPNAVRELLCLGFSMEELDQVGVQTQEWALVGLNGKDIYAEPRGLQAGYKWPQYSVHRGRLQMLLLRAVRERLGSEAIELGCTVTGYRNHVGGRGVTAQVRTGGGIETEVSGALLIGADGLHSAVRAQMHPHQPPIHWGGQIMWRGVTQGTPIRSGASFIGLGTHNHRFVFYPISAPDAKTGLATINWIAEIAVDTSEDRASGDWNKKVGVEDFIHHFHDWRYQWLDVPAMLRGAETIYEYPMVDRDPVPTWVDGKVALLGDAAHVMYPVGSNGASQAIVDARVLGAAFVKRGVNCRALKAYDDALCRDVSAVVLRNREAGPFGILNILDERCGGNFDDIEHVIPREEIDEYMAAYKRFAGFAMDSLNRSLPIIEPDARVAPRQSTLKQL